MAKTDLLFQQANKIDSTPALTLIESVLALAILSIGLFVLVSTTAKCLAIVRISRNYHTARTVLEQGEIDYPLRETNTVEDNVVPTVEYPCGFTFSRELEAVGGEDALFIVTTRVSWSETGHKSFEEVTSYLYCPSTD